MATKLHTISNAARLVSVHPRTIKNWIAAGTLPVVRLGDGQRDRRVREADLLAFIDARTERRES